MDAQVVHEQTDLGVSVGLLQPGEVLEELVDVDRPLEDLVVLLPLLLRDATEQRQCGLIKSCNID